MMDNRSHSNKEIFEYHYLKIKDKITIRYGTAPCLQGSAKGLFLLLHGRTEFIEKYKWVANHLQKKGFLVISPDWRGQGLSSRELENRHKGHIHSFEDYVNDLEIFYSRIIEPRDLPVYILAHSMGGHIALRFMSRGPARIKKAILASPMVDIKMSIVMKQVSKILSKQLSKTRLATGYALGSGDYSIKKVKFKGNYLCHDPEKYWILHNEIAKNPDLAIGGVTWGWLNAAFDSIEILKQEKVINKITTPILLISAQKDSIVSSLAQKQLSRKLSDCSFYSIQGAFHELFFEEIEFRTQLWEAFDQFVSAKLSRALMP